MRIVLAGLLAVASLPSPAVEGRTQRIDPQQSRADFKLSMRLPVPGEGRFRTVAGEVRELPGLQLSVTVELDARELDMAGPAWVQRVTESPQFLDSARHPRIRFVSEPFSQQVLVSGGEIGGQLLVRGVTGGIRFTVAPAACRQPGISCPILAQGRLNRQDFGMDAYRWGLRDEVQFAFQLKFADE